MNVKSWIKDHSLLSYFLLTYLITWTIALPNIAKVQGWFDLSIPMASHYLTAFGPLLAALIMTYITKGKTGIRTFLKRLVQWKNIAKPVWLVTISLLIVFIITYTFLFLAGVAPDISGIGNINYLPNIGLFALPLWILTNGVGEEGGWRGFALPKLLEKHGPLKSSVILAIFWSVWHAFAFFYIPNYMNLGWAVIGFFFGILAGSIVFTWIYKNSKGSVLTSILFHGFLNFTTASRLSDKIIAPVITTLVMVFAVYLVYTFTRKSSENS